MVFAPSDQQNNNYYSQYGVFWLYNGGIPYLFVSAGSGGGSGFMYLNWIIVTYGVPYVVSVS